MARRPVFALSLHDVRRTQGAYHPFTIEAEFDQPVEAGLVTLPAGRPVRLGGDLTSVGDGILVRARATTTMDAQCSRCLTGFSYPAQVEVEELFVYPEKEADYDEEPVSLIRDDSLDLTGPLRDALILDQPLIPLCQPDCAGLCPRCGVDLNADPGHDHGDAIDSRWIGLAEWGKMS